MLQKRWVGGCAKEHDVVDEHVFQKKKESHLSLHTGTLQDTQAAPDIPKADATAKEHTAHPSHDCQIFIADDACEQFAWWRCRCGTSTGMAALTRG